MSHSLEETIALQFDLVFGYVPTPARAALIPDPLPSMRALDGDQVEEAGQQEINTGTGLGRRKDEWR